MMLTEERIKIAIDRFEQGWTCSQAILSSYCEAYSLSVNTAKALSCGFAGGMRYGETCGVVTASIMIIGLWSFTKTDNETKQKKLCFDTVAKFMADFTERQNHINCRDILGYDIRNPEERKKHPGQQGKLCPQVLRNGIQVLEDNID
jgi:C_GCAxxG_C_C family probable redox protein